MNNANKVARAKLVKEAAKEIHNRLDTAIFEGFMRLSCYSESHIAGLAAFTGRTYEGALAMLNRVNEKNVLGINNEEK